MSRSKNRDSSPLVFSGVPRANLMPPEVAQGRREAVRRRGLFSLVALVVLVVIGGVVFATIYAGQAADRLADERRVTEQLLAEQLTYQEALEVRSQLNDIIDQRRAVTEREILWRDIVSPYVSIVTEDGVLESVTMTTAALADPPLVRQDPLRYPPTATIVMTVFTTERPQPSTWLRGFEGLDTHGDSSLDSLTRQEDDSYLTTITINLNSSALSGRLTDEAAN